MKKLLKTHEQNIFITILVLFMAGTVFGYFFQDSVLGKMILYYSRLSPLVIVLLTLAYVITTQRQLKSMEKQLDIMDSSVRLQIQPLPVPSIDDVKLEKIRPYLSPVTNFEKVELLSRFHFDITFKNAGTGAALNTTVFASILIRNRKEKDIVIEIPQFSPKQIHLICEDEKKLETFMLVDREFEIFNSLNNNDEVILKLKIYYKNIFGSGFLQNVVHPIKAYFAS